MHVDAYITCARAHGGTKRGREGGKEGGLVTTKEDDGVVRGVRLPLSAPPHYQPLPSSLGLILSTTGTQFSRVRCSFEFRFPAHSFVRLVHLYASISQFPLAPHRSSFARFLLPRRLICAIYLSPLSLMQFLLRCTCYFVYFSLVPLCRLIRQWRETNVLFRFRSCVILSRLIARKAL